ncbi:E3 SUMO-protein ligase RanBP2-like [Nylanderia fulva]|uniref:E3 SUMO-protein ligase RanBP2-like n=1 Tax=Nylanderia fulva TaxID=613905 RepID=UPI0010FB5674|nr:E3 SUMO-protein ligase RanBP2-like [Nylanderia fulva]
MATSIRSLLSPFLIISYVCGLRIVEFPTGHLRFWFSLFYILLFWSTYCFLVINKGLSYVPKYSAEYRLYVSLNIFITLLSMLLGVYHDKGHVDCWAPDIEYKSKLENQNLKNKIIMRENEIMLKKIRQVESEYPTREFLKDWKSMHEAVEHRARYVSVIERLSSSSQVQKQLAEKSQTRCFFDIGLKGENQKLGRIVFELYNDIVPRTCENFAAFCRGINGLSYKNTPFHRIVSGYWCQGGDVTKFDGTGGTSIYGDSFDKENSNLRHMEPGILSMCDNDDGRNDSKFNLAFKRLKTVDGDRVVFGRVIGGMRNIYKVMLDISCW